MGNKKNPYFEDCKEFAPIKSKETSRRKNVFAIIEHPVKKKYMLLHWEKIGWKSFVVGGLNKNETYEEAAIRETIEETGFCDIKYTKTIAGEFQNLFFAKHKDINRLSIEKYVFLKLNSLNSVPVDEGETINHVAIWIDKGKVSNFLNLDNNLYAWRLFISGKKEDEEYLKILKHFKKLI